MKILNPKSHLVMIMRVICDTILTNHTGIHVTIRNVYILMRSIYAEQEIHYSVLYITSLNRK
jgi:hypothetical protein